MKKAKFRDWDDVSMEEAKDVKFINTETGEVLIEFDTLKVGNIAEKEEKNEKNT